MTDLDDLRKYLRALETGDPDIQLCNPDNDIIIVRWAVGEIERLKTLLDIKQETIKAREKEIRRAYRQNERLRSVLERIVNALEYKTVIDHD